VLPPEISKLTSLKVFSVQKNQITELPLCLADMVSLQVLKLDGNPITFPPKEVLSVQAASPSNEGILKDSEVTEVTVTAHIKRYLKERMASNYRPESDHAAEESSEGAETPRVPRRPFTGRFPVKVNGTEMPDIRSPALGRPPPIPTRSHFRGLSQQNVTIRKPGVMPLTIGNANERLRSNSETLLQASKGGERPESRNRRMGMVSRNISDLGTLDETQANNRFSIHSRGLSHGSAMQSNSSALVNQTPASPAEQYLQRPVYVRRLSILPERRRVSKVLDPVLEAAKGILYSVFQIHPMIQMLMSLTNDGTAKRSSLEIVFYNTSAHVEELEAEIQRHDPLMNDDVYGGLRENETVHHKCLTLVNAYAHVCASLVSNADVFIDNGDPRYIRTLLTQLYNSIMELRVTTQDLSANQSTFRFPANRAPDQGTIRPQAQPKELMVSDRTLTNGMMPNGSTVPRTIRTGNLTQQPTNLRVATDVAFPYINGTGRTATITSATPRSGESFASSSTASGGRGMSDFTEEDRMFEKIFLSLQKSTDLVQRTLPSFSSYFSSAARKAAAHRDPEHIVQVWRKLYERCTATIQLTDALKSRLSKIKLKEPGVRSSAFWNQCNAFIDAWAELGREIKRALEIIPLPADTKSRLRPIQIGVKDTMDIILASPWAFHIARNPSSGGGVVSPYGGQLSRPSTAQMQNLPMTPQSAALGPAVQSAVPSTPQSASFASAFTGNVFERADALMASMGGGMNSRSGTMTNSSSTSLSSVSSTLSSGMGLDGIATPASMVSLVGAGSLDPVAQSQQMGARMKYDGWGNRGDVTIR
jgi:hypothetical protein